MMMPNKSMTNNNDIYDKEDIAVSTKIAAPSFNDDTVTSNTTSSCDDTTATTTSITPIEIRQKLLSVDEVYLYKIPPLQNAGGHRAENWNLAKPLATCSLLVERRDDCLVLEFRQQSNDGVSSSSTTTTTGSSNTTQKPIFAQAIIDCSIVPTTNISNTNTNELPLSIPPQQQQRKIQHWIEGTIDSSRYFTLRITNNNNNSKSTGTTANNNTSREAIIGFGFRNRDDAIDLREALQYYESSMRRQYEAAINSIMNRYSSNENDNIISSSSSSNDTLSSSPLNQKYVIPKLAENERIHIRLKQKDGHEIGATKTKKNHETSPNKNRKPNSSICGLLLKKPPPPAAAAPVAGVVEGTIHSGSNNSSNININQNNMNTTDVVVNDDDDDDEWDTEFVSASTG